MTAVRTILRTLTQTTLASAIFMLTCKPGRWLLHDALRTLRLYRFVIGQRRMQANSPEKDVQTCKCYCEDVPLALLVFVFCAFLQREREKAVIAR